MRQVSSSIPAVPDASGAIAGPGPMRDEKIRGDLHPPTTFYLMISVG